MSFNCTNFMLTIIFFTALFLVLCAGKVSYYIVTEHAVISHVNPKYVRDTNFTSTRHGRRNPMYYVEIHYTALLPFDEKFKVDFYFYEFLSNEYRRGFVEMHFTWCNLIHKDMFFGAAMRQGKLAGPCPYPPGEYHLYNMSIPSAAIPPGFPFTKGRIYANLTNRGEDVFGGYIDMELKERRTRPGIPALFYLLTLASMGSYLHGFLVSPLWFIFCRPGSDLVDKIINFSLCMSSFIGITKYTSMYWQREDLQEIVRAYLLFDSQVDPHSRMARNIKRSLKDVKKRAMTIWILVMSNVTVYFVVPLVTPGRHLTDERQIMWGLEPMVESPNYEMSFIIVVTCVFITVYAPVVIAMLLIVVVGYTEAHMTALGQELDNLWDDAQDDVRQRELEHTIPIETNKAALVNHYAKRRLETIIEAHAVNKKLIKQVERVFRNPEAFSFICLSIALIADLLGGLENTYMQIPFAMVLVAMDCIAGQRLLDANVTFEAAVYASGWERLDARNQRLVLLLLRSAQDPMRLSAGGVLSLGYAALGAITKSVYSAHAALHSTISKG